MNYLSISKNLREGESEKRSLKLEADGCTWNLNSCLSLLPVRLLISLLASEAQCSHLPKGVTDADLQGDFEDKIVCVLESCSHLPKPPGDVLCILCPPCSDVFPCSRLPPKAPPLCQVPFPRIYLCAENPCHTVAVHTFTTCSLPRNANQRQPGIFQGNLGAPTSFPQEGRLPSGLLAWGPPGFFFLGTDLHSPNKGLSLVLSLRKTTNQPRNIQPPDLQSQIWVWLSSWPPIKGPWVAFCISKPQCHHLYKESNVCLVALFGRLKIYVKPLIEVME